MLWGSEGSTQVLRWPCDLDFTCLSVIKTTLISINTTKFDCWLMWSLWPERETPNLSFPFPRQAAVAGPSPQHITDLKAKATLRVSSGFDPCSSIGMTLFYSINHSIPPIWKARFCFFFVQVRHKTTWTIIAFPGVGICSVINSQALKWTLSGPGVWHWLESAMLLIISYSGL